MPSAQTNAGSVTRPEQINLGFSVSEHVHMRRQMVVGVDNDAQAIDPQDGDHESH